MEDDYELLYLATEDYDEVVKVLYDKYKDMIYYKISKYTNNYEDFKDYLNEARLTLHEAILGYRDNYHFKTYLSKCLDNKLLNYQKSQNRKKKSIDSSSVELTLSQIYQIEDPSSQNGPEENVLNNEDYEEFYKNIREKFTWKEELIFSLKSQNYTNKEITEITGISLNNIYQIIRRIRNKISATIE